MSPRRLVLIRAAVLAAAALGTLPAGAAVTWVGNGSNTNWATTTNWSNLAGPGTSDTAVFTDTGSSTLPAETTVLFDTNHTIGGMSFTDNAGKYHTVNLAGHTLTISGNLNFNLDQNTQTTTTLRDGQLVVSGSFANINVGIGVSGSSKSIVDFSGLSSLNATVQNFLVGASTSGNTIATLTLSPSNTISANLIQVGASNNSSDTNGTLHLGLSNSIITPEFDVAQNNSNALVDIVSGGTLNLGTPAQLTLLQVANQNYNNQYNSYTGQMNLGNAAVNLYLSSLVVAEKNGGPGGTTGVLQGGSRGAVVVGSPSARGNVYVGYSVNGGSATGTADLSNLTSFQATVNDFFVGKNLAGSATGTVLLPPTSSINAANSVVVGYGGGGNNTLTLGRTSTTLLTPQLIIGANGSTALVQVAPGAAVTLGSPAQRTSLTVADNNYNNQYVGYTSELNLTGAVFNAYLSQLIVGQKDGGPGGSSGTLLGGTGGAIDIGPAGNTANVYVGNSITGGGNATGLADLSGLTSLNANLNTLAIGTAASGSALGTLKLPATTTINANTIVVGDNLATPNLNTSTLVLGLHSTILANQVSIGQDFTNGLVQIPSGGTLALGSPAQRTNLSIATTNTGDPYNAYSGTLDLTNASVTAYLGNVIIGNKGASPNNETGLLIISNHADNYVNATSITLGSNQMTGILTLGGGALVAQSLSAGTGNATFNWTGGTVSIATIGTPAIPFNIVNTGTGTLAPGPAPGTTGTTTIYGTYTQGAAAATAIQIAGVSPGTGNDQFNVTGAATFAGTLNLSTVDGFVPSVGQNFLIATYASHSGAFAFVAPPVLPQNVAFQLNYTSNSTQLLVHTVTPTAQSWTSSSAAGTWSTPGSWSGADRPHHHHQRLRHRHRRQPPDRHRRRLHHRPADHRPGQHLLHDPRSPPGRPVGRLLRTHRRHPRHAPRRRQHPRRCRRQRRHRRPRNPLPRHPGRHRRLHRPEPIHHPTRPRRRHALAMRLAGRGRHVHHGRPTGRRGYQRLFSFTRRHLRPPRLRLRHRPVRPGGPAAPRDGSGVGSFSFVPRWPDQRGQRPGTR